MHLYSASRLNHMDPASRYFHWKTETLWENRREHTDELLISDVQGHVPERRGYCAHHTVVIYSKQLHKDGQAFLFPDSGSDVHWPLWKDEGKDLRNGGGKP